MHKAEFYQTLFAGLFICLALPPTISLVRWVPEAQGLRGRPVLSHLFTIGMAVVAVLLFGFSVSKLGNFSPFLYFQF